jgi:hypothetical protein
VYRSFEVENFRGLSSVALDDLSLINILTGLNDAGKTTVLEAIFLHSSGPLAGVSTVQTLRPARRQDPINFGQYGENPWTSLFRNFDMTVPIRFVATMTTGKYELEIHEGGKGQSFNPSEGVGTGPLASSNSLVILEKRGDENQNRYVQSLNVSTTAGIGPAQNFSLDFRLEPAVAEAFSPASIVKGQLGMDLALAYSESRRKPSGLDVLDSLREIDDRIEALEVLIAGGRPQLHASIRGQLVPFELLGDGPVAMAQYLLAMAAAKGGTLLIDEVGAGLHYTVLSRMWRSIYRAAKRLNVQVFATTHSQESVVAAQAVIKDRAHDLSVYRLDRARADEATRVSRYSDEKLATAVELNAELR